MYHSGGPTLLGSLDPWQPNISRWLLTIIGICDPVIACEEPPGLDDTCHNVPQTSYLSGSPAWQVNDSASKRAVWRVSIERLDSP